MTSEEAIKYWEGLRKTFSSQLEKEENHFGRMHLQTTIDVIDTTLSALRAQQERNDPLTLDEIRQMDGEPVWVKHYKGGEWVTVHWDIYDCITTAYKAALRADEYGDRWLAYRRKPEEGTE